MNLGAGDLVLIVVIGLIGLKLFRKPKPATVLRVDAPAAMVPRMHFEPVREEPLVSKSVEAVREARAKVAALEEADMARQYEALLHGCLRPVREYVIPEPKANPRLAPAEPASPK